MLMLGSANTDEGEVEDADAVRFDREVNRHIAFGGGIHRCLGSHLARMELRVALREWHRRIPEYSVEPGHTLVYTPNIRSIEHFPMRFTAGPGFLGHGENPTPGAPSQRGGDASVDRDDGAGEIGPGPRGQEDGGARHVVGPADALERRAGGDLLTEGVQGGGHHFGSRTVPGRWH